MTMIKYAGEDIRVRNVHTQPSKFRLGDILLGPEGMLLKVVTVQSAPYFENLRKSKTVVIFETEPDSKGQTQIIPVNPMFGEYDVYRR